MTDRIEIAQNFMSTREHRAGIGEVATAVGMSPFALMRMFTACLGISPNAYMRRARLLEVAERLQRDRSLTLTDAAFDAGFESQQTFTRAFTKWFGLPPGQYRQEEAMRKPAEVPAAERERAAVEVEGELLHLPALRVAGFEVTVDGTGSPSPRNAWASLDPRLPVMGQEPGYTLGVCWQEPDDEGFVYLAGVVLQADAVAPVGMLVREIPAQTYAVFRQHMVPGPFLPQLRAGLQSIWADKLPALAVTPNGGPDMEIYPDDLIAGQSEGWLTYRIPVTTNAQPQLKSSA